MLARIKHWLTHVHEWETLNKADIVTYGSVLYPHEARKVGEAFTLRCNSCGTIKRKRV